jgi:hypothetical protein
MNAIQSRRRFLGVLSAGAAATIAPAALAATLTPAVGTAPSGLLPGVAAASEFDPIYVAVSDAADRRPSPRTDRGPRGRSAVSQIKETRAQLGAMGGNARMAKLTPDGRRQLARRAATARWKGKA